MLDAPEPVASCFGESGAETDASSEMNATQFHSRSRNTFSSCSVREIAFIVFFECGMKIVPADVWGRRLSG